MPVQLPFSMMGVAESVTIIMAKPTFAPHTPLARPRFFGSYHMAMMPGPAVMAAPYPQPSSARVTRMPASLVQNRPAMLPTMETSRAMLTTLRAPKRSMSAPPNSAMTTAAMENIVIMRPWVV